MDNQFSQKVSDIILFSKEEAARLKNSSIYPEHLILGIIRDNNNKVIDIFGKLGIDVPNLKFQFENAVVNDNVDSSANATQTELSFSPNTTRILKICILEARFMKVAMAGVEHIILAILKDGQSTASKILEANGLTYNKAYEIVSTLKPSKVNDGMGFSEDNDEDSYYPDSTNKREDSKFKTISSKVDNETPVLNNFGIDVTKAAIEGMLDPVVGREKEIERVAQILTRRKKNNPILIGEPGVGKSAIIEGLAQRIVQKKVSRLLFEKRIIMLDLSSVVAGTKFRGQFEERLHALINELQNNPNIILFIDEIHTIVGAGSAPGSMDAANILKPALSRGSIQCIGATTLSEFRNSIEKDGALERRFQKVIVEPTTPDETLQILHNIKERYEDHHNVIYTEDALEACVKLTNQYISDRFFPDKAIDVLDEAGSRVHLSNIAVPKEIENQEKKIEETRKNKTMAVQSQNFELAASFRDEEKVLQTELEKLKEDWENHLKSDKKIVDYNEISVVVSMMSGIPVQKMAKAESSKLASLAKDLKSTVIGQDNAIDKITKCILRTRIGLKDPNHSIGIFMFLGPTGVGKTYLAQQLANLMFGSVDALIRIDMSEFIDKYTVSKLIGAPPGYVGYEEGGQLTEKVRRKPYSIILLDEIEKAHPEVFNILLQVMDEGRLTDSYGRTVDFKNTIIIMTSNVGSRQIKDFGKGIGFSTYSKDDENSSIIRKALNRQFSPEFLNRIDEIVSFNQLSLSDMSAIIEVELNKLLNRVSDIGYKMVVDDEVKEFIRTKGYDPQLGARPLKRTIQSYIEDGLSENIVNEKFIVGDTIKVALSDDKQDIVFTKLNI